MHSISRVKGDAHLVWGGAWRVALLLVLLGGLVIVGALAQEAEDESESELVIFFVDSKGQELTGMAGQEVIVEISSDGSVLMRHPDPAKARVRILYKDTVVEADVVEYDSDAQVARLSGNVRLQQERLSVSGDKMTAKVAQEEYEISGNAELVRFAENEDDGEPVVEFRLTADNIRLDGRSRDMVARGSVQAKQESRTIEADEMDYSDEQRLLTFRGNVYATGSDPRFEAHCPLMVIDLESDRVSIYEYPRLTFTVEEGAPGVEEGQ